eukprot:9329808-Pyramimonas_sp.AAC.3
MEEGPGDALRQEEATMSGRFHGLGHDIHTPPRPKSVQNRPLDPSRGPNVPVFRAASSRGDEEGPREPKKLRTQILEARSSKLYLKALSPPQSAGQRGGGMRRGRSARASRNAARLSRNGYGQEGRMEERDEREEREREAPRQCTVPCASSGGKRMTGREGCGGRGAGGGGKGPRKEEGRGEEGRRRGGGESGSTSEGEEERGGAGRASVSTGPRTSLLCGRPNGKPPRGRRPTPPGAATKLTMGVVFFLFALKARSSLNANRRRNE